jgi:hypothetical protein
MSKKVLIEAFFSQFNAFLSELATSYPDDTEFPVFIETLNLGKFANPMLVINYVKNEIAIPYRTKIENRDESFFMNFDYTKKQDVDLNIVEKLKGYMSTMSDSSKKVVWDYIDVITRIVIKISESQ